MGDVLSCARLLFVHLVQDQDGCVIVVGSPYQRKEEMNAIRRLVKLWRLIRSGAIFCIACPDKDECHTYIRATEGKKK